MTAARFGVVLGLKAVLANSLPTGIAAGIVFGLLSGPGIQFLSGTAELEPSRVRIRVFRRARGRRGRFVRRFVVGFTAGLLFELLTGVVLGLLFEVGVLELLFGTRSLGVSVVVAVLRTGSVLGPPVGLLLGLAIGLTAWLETPVDIRSAVNPTRLLNTNRTTVLVLMLTWCCTFGIGAWLMGEFGGPGGLKAGLINGLDVGLLGGASGAIAYGLSLTAWGQWVTLSRIWLPLTGRLPWAVHAFLDDAYQRGVLRQTGAVYQFRHARLQDHLTQAFMVDDKVKSPNGKRFRHGGSGYTR